uniref:CCHC-type domain-containing protein n=1 Tax=Tetradesmus obliquus TaxID=3088 RepID=A0A383V646_TETOB
MNELGLRVRFGEVHHSEWKRHVESHADAKGWLSALTTADDPNSGKVLYLIQTSLDSKTTALTINCKTAKDLYDKLNSLYQSSSIAQTQQLTKAFVNAEQQPGEKVEGWGARLSMCQADLAAAGAPVTDDTGGKDLLVGLLPMFDIPKSHFISAAQLPSVIDMLPKLMEWQSLKESSADEPLQAQSYFTSGSSGSSGYGHHGSSAPGYGHYNNAPSGYGQYGSSASGHGYNNTNPSGPADNRHGYNNGPSGPADNLYGLNNGGSQPPLKCLYCHKAGHRIQDCRGRMRAEQRRTGNSDPGNDSTHHAGNTPKASSKKPIFW